MPIYTRGGDKGQTGLLSSERVPKNHPRVEAYGSVDELNAVLGLVLHRYQGPRRERLKEIQRTLFAMGAQLASAKPTNALGMEASEVMRMEKEMDAMEKALPPLRNFILPGGSVAATMLHLARTVARRAERRVIALAQTETVEPQIIVYLNRLGDWLFMLAREENARAGVQDEEWHPEKKEM